MMMASMQDQEALIRCAMLRAKMQMPYLPRVRPPLSSSTFAGCATALCTGPVKTY